MATEIIGLSRAINNAFMECLDQSGVCPFCDSLADPDSMTWGIDYAVKHTDWCAVPVARAQLRNAGETLEFVPSHQMPRLYSGVPGSQPVDIADSLTADANPLEDFRPDWTQLWNPEQAERQLTDFKFAGPGWYLSNDDTLLVTATEQRSAEKAFAGKWEQGEQFWFHVWNNRSPGHAFNQIVNAPVREDKRG